MQSTEARKGTASLSDLFSRWKEVILTCNLRSERPMDGVSKWLILTRACVFSMTLTSGVVGGFLALGAWRASGGTAEFNILNFALAVIGLGVAHASNNLINDYFDEAVGLDTAEDYARAQYAPHPLISGLVTRAGMLRAILLLNAVDLAILIFLTVMRGPVVIAFALAGLFISVFYTAPPVRLKRIGLGEIGVVLVWGPLMIGGTYYVTAGEVPVWVLAASLPYALLVGTVLVGKHIDKIHMDRPKGIHTLPVLIGEKAALRLNQFLFVAFYFIIAALVVSQSLSVWVLLVAFSIPMLLETLKLYSAPKPAEPPENYPVWPLWFVSIAFRFTRLAGGLLILGLLLHGIFPLMAPFKLF